MGEESGVVWEEEVAEIESPGSCHSTDSAGNANNRMALTEKETSRTPRCAPRFSGKKPGAATNRGGLNTLRTRGKGGLERLALKGRGADQFNVERSGTRRKETRKEIRGHGSSLPLYGPAMKR